MQPFALQNHVRSLVEATVVRLGFELVAVEWTGGQRGPVLRLSVDRAGGVSAQNCAEVLHAVSPLLDEDDPIVSSYNLEVSSPGIERPVQRAADFERFVGYTLSLRLVEGHPRRRYKGTLSAWDDGEITITVDGAPHVVRIDTVEKANLVLTLDEYQNLNPYDAPAQAEEQTDDHQ